MKATPDRKQPAVKERSARGERAASEPEAARERRSGEGSASALANLKSIERDRQNARPADENCPEG